MADAHNVKEPPSQFKLNLSKQAWHQVGRIAMLDELLRDIRTARAFSGNHVLDQAAIVIWLSEKRKAEVGKLPMAGKRLALTIYSCET